MKTSKEYDKAYEKWVGQRVRYSLIDAFARKQPALLGPWTGVVDGISDNGAIIEDELEGHSHTDKVDFTGCLMVRPDHIEGFAVHTPSETHCEIIEEDEDAEV